MLIRPMYHIATDPFMMNGMDESDFSDDTDRELLGADYVENYNSDAAAEHLSILKDELSNAGFDIITMDLPNDCAFAFKTGNKTATVNAKTNWFQPHLKALKDMVNTMDPAAFASDTAVAYRMQKHINDCMDRMIYLDMGTGPSTYTIMSCVRNLQPDTTYYVDNVVVRLH